MGCGRQVKQIGCRVNASSREDTGDVTEDITDACSTRKTQLRTMESGVKTSCWRTSQSSTERQLGFTGQAQRDGPAGRR